MWPNSQESAGLVIFTKDILMKNFIFCQYNAKYSLQRCFEINGIPNRVYLPMEHEKSSLMCVWKVSSYYLWRQFSGLWKSFKAMTK